MTNTKPLRLDRWNHVEGDASMATAVWAESKFVIINRTIKAQGKIHETFLPITYDELDRLIAALQRAREQKREANV